LVEDAEELNCLSQPLLVLEEDHVLKQVAHERA
jgi:hypothetical protein